MTAAEFSLCCFNAGLTAAEIENWNVGTIIDFITIKNRSMSQDQHDDEERYKQLKAVEPLVEERYKNGLISKEKYEKFKQQLSEWR